MTDTVVFLGSAITVSASTDARAAGGGSTLGGASSVVGCSAQTGTAPGRDVAADLDPGERDAIQLALERSPILLLIDERQGAKVAKALNILTTGTLGIIVKAAESGLIEVDEALDRLSQTNFRCTPQLFEHARQLAFRQKSDLNTAKGPAFS